MYREAGQGKTNTVTALGDPQSTVEFEVTMEVAWWGTWGQSLELYHLTLVSRVVHGQQLSLQPDTIAAAATAHPFTPAQACSLPKSCPAQTPGLLLCSLPPHLPCSAASLLL